MAKAKGTPTNRHLPQKKLQLLPRYRYVLLDKQGHIAVIRLDFLGVFEHFDLVCSEPVGNTL